MKIIAFFLLALSAAVYSAGPTYAQQTGASYEKGLQMVREAKYQPAMAEFLPLAQEGHAPSQFSVGLMYHLGRGVRTDPAVAYDWYKKAVLQEHPPAMNNMGMMYLNGEYVAQDRMVAFKLFEKASLQHAQAKDNLGQCYDNGWGVAPNAAQAINYYQQAGDAGYVLGYFHAGELFEKGAPDLPKNIDRAVEFYILAADKGLEKAKIRLRELNRLPDTLKQ